MSDSLRDVVRSLPDQGVAVIDRAGTITAWNPAAASITGHDELDAVARDLRWLHTPAQPSERPASSLPDVESGPASAAGWRPRKDGGAFWCESTLFAIRDGHGELIGFAETFVDATAARQRTLALEHTEAMLAAALRSDSIVVTSQDLELRFTFAHDVPAEPRPDSPDDRVRRTWSELVVAPDAAARLTEAKRAVIASGTGARCDVAGVFDGSTVHYDVTVEPLRDSDGAVVGITSVAVDVTRRRAAEDELARARRRLAEAEALARMGSYEYDVLEDRVHWSDGLLAVYGLKPGDVPEHYTASIERIHPEDRERRDAAVRRALETGESFELDYRIVRPDGRTRQLHARAEVTVDEDGRPLRLTGTVLDVTDTREAERALQETAAELARRVAGLRRRGQDATRPDAERNGALSERQREILALVAEGLNNADIAARLGLSETTVKWHMGNILRRLGVTNRAQAIARYLSP